MGCCCDIPDSMDAMLKPWDFAGKILNEVKQDTSKKLRKKTRPFDQTNKKNNLLVVSTPLKNISQIGSFPQVGVKIKNIRNHQPDKPCRSKISAF